eukprot:Polyplicarium_translucidae@DN3267_c0_g2_i2.p3
MAIFRRRRRPTLLHWSCTAMVAAAVVNQLLYLSEGVRLPRAASFLELGQASLEPPAAAAGPGAEELLGNITGSLQAVAQATENSREHLAALDKISGTLKEVRSDVANDAETLRDTVIEEKLLGEEIKALEENQLEDIKKEVSALADRAHNA